MPLALAVRILMICLLLLLAFAGPMASGTAAVVPAPGTGFWEGLVHGFLSLPKLLVSPFLDVTLVSAGGHLLRYDIGFYIGVLLFAGAGAAVATPPAAVDGYRKEWIRSGRSSQADIDWR